MQLQIQIPTSEPEEVQAAAQPYSARKHRSDFKIYL